MDTDTQGRNAQNDGGRDLSAAPSSQGTTSIARKHQTLGRDKDSPLSLQREHGPPNTLISDLLPPDHERINYGCYKPSTFVLLFTANLETDTTREGVSFFPNTGISPETHQGKTRSRKAGAEDMATSEGGTPRRAVFPQLSEQSTSRMKG